MLRLISYKKVCNGRILKLFKQSALICGENIIFRNNTLCNPKVLEPGNSLLSNYILTLSIF